MNARYYNGAPDVRDEDPLNSPTGLMNTTYALRLQVAHLRQQADAGSPLADWYRALADEIEARLAARETVR